MSEWFGRTWFRQIIDWCNMGCYFIVLESMTANVLWIEWRCLVCHIVLSNVVLWGLTRFHTGARLCLSVLHFFGLDGSVWFETFSLCRRIILFSVFLSLILSHSSRIIVRTWSGEQCIIVDPISRTLRSLFLDVAEGCAHVRLSCFVLDTLTPSLFYGSRVFTENWE